VALGRNTVRLMRCGELVDRSGSRIVSCSAWADLDDDESERLYSASLDRMLEGQARIMRLADPIRVAGAHSCGQDISPVLGVFAADSLRLLSQ
jgi:hypothetical protein